MFLENSSTHKTITAGRGGIVFYNTDGETDDFNLNTSGVLDCSGDGRTAATKTISGTLTLFGGSSLIDPDGVLIKPTVAFSGCTNADCTIVGPLV